jgi:hypothetical protein
VPGGCQYSSITSHFRTGRDPRWMVARSKFGSHNVAVILMLVCSEGRVRRQTWADGSWKSAQFLKLMSVAFSNHTMPSRIDGGVSLPRRKRIYSDAKSLPLSTMLHLCFRPCHQYPRRLCCPARCWLPVFLGWVSYGRLCGMRQSVSQIEDNETRAGYTQCEVCNRKSSDSHLFVGFSYLLKFFRG